MNGYQIIEPIGLDSMTAKVKSTGLKIGVLLWVINEIKDSELIKSNLKTIRIIKVSYHGDYPAIGIQYKFKNPVDISVEIENACNAIVNSSSFLDFYNFIHEHSDKIDSEVQLYLVGKY